MEVLMRINDMKLRNLFGKDLKMPEKMVRQSITLT
jgi:hypothetical protein